MFIELCRFIERKMLDEDKVSLAKKAIEASEAEITIAIHSIVSQTSILHIVRVVFKVCGSKEYREVKHNLQPVD